MPTRRRDPPRRPSVRSARNAPEASESVGEAEIAVHWREEPLIPPPPSLARRAAGFERGIRERFAHLGYPECFTAYADLLTWSRRWTRTLDDSRPPFYRWFVGGKLNASANCIDRHLADRADRAALRFVPEPESEGSTSLTYRELYERVNATAAFLRDRVGLKAGDRVTIHLPMTLDLPVTMLACARLGVVHSVVFAGFSGEACGQRIADSGSRVLITADAYWRNGHLQDHLTSANRAVATAAREGQAVEAILRWQRYPGRASSSTAVRGAPDLVLNEALDGFRGREVPPEPMDSDAPLFLMYTSGTTGRPKGAQHSTGGYLAYVAGTARLVLDIHAEDVYWCLADIGWITGHSYIVYGPLALGTCSVIYEGAPTHPDSGRPWRIAEAHRVNLFHTSPTAIRQLRRLGPEEPTKYRYRFRVMASVGEPIEPETWRWYFDVVGKGHAAIVDTWWQTETGGILSSTLPALDPMKPGSTGPPLPGIHPVVLDDEGRSVPPGTGRAGNIVLTEPWPGMMQTIWGDPDRFLSTYFARYNADAASRERRDWPYFAGDGAMVSPEGYIRILGRIDDVINVAGHRLGTKELESACLTVPGVAEAAVVPAIDEVRGRVPIVYVSLRPGSARPEAFPRRVIEAIELAIGKIARPREVWVVAEMPKTRSGKIMRRVLAAISNGRDPGDVSTLSEPAVVDAIRAQVEKGSAGSRSRRRSEPTVPGEGEA